MNILGYTAAVAGASVLCKLAFLPPPPRELWYKGKHALHGGFVSSDILAHLCDIRDILENEAHDPSCDAAFQRLLGKIRAFYMAIHLKRSHAEVKTIGLEATGELTRFEAFIARSSFIIDMAASIAFIKDEVMDSMIAHQRPSANRRSLSLSL